MLQQIILMAMFAGVSGCCTGSTSTGSATRSASREAKNSSWAELERCHLGDGIITHDYYFIGDYLEKHPGSAKHARDTERSQRRAQQTSGMNALKPPSANISETEFSHLLGAVATSNGGVGAAVFDMHRLKVGGAGVQLESIVLSGGRFASAVGATNAPLVVRYTCSRLRNLERTCSPTATRGIPCWDLKKIAKACTRPFVALYRPVRVRDDADRWRVVGVSMIVGLD